MQIKQLQRGGKRNDVAIECWEGSIVAVLLRPHEVVLFHEQKHSLVHKQRLHSFQSYMCTLQFPAEWVHQIGNQYLVSTFLPSSASLPVRECMEGFSCFRLTDFHGKVGEDALRIMNRGDTLTCDFDRRVFRIVLCELNIREPQICLSLNDFP